MVCGRDCANEILFYLDRDCGSDYEKGLSSGADVYGHDDEVDVFWFIMPANR